jgi:hypothetical protein
MSKAKKYFIITAIFAFISVISFFQINSYWADQHRFNGLLGWLGIGIVTGLVAIYFLIQTYRNSNGGGSGIGAR